MLEVSYQIHLYLFEKHEQTQFYFRHIPLHWVIVNNLISLSIDPADPALQTLILEAASREFEAHRLTSHVMILMGIFHGES